MNFNPEQTPIPVSLDRTLPFESGIEYNPDYYYRMIGEKGYQDFIEQGVIRAKQDSKHNYEQAYYFKGHPLDRYSEKGKEVDYFVEVDSEHEDLFEVSALGQYPRSLSDISDANKIRIYKVEAGKGTIVFDSM